jgi:Lhr-like helicase
MRLENYTNIPTEKIREMIRFVKPKYSGVSKLNNITVLNCNYGYSGFFRGTQVYRMQELRVFYMKPDEVELVVTLDPVIEKNGVRGSK